MRRRTLRDVDRQLATSSARALRYGVRGDERSVAIERHVQNRLLDERLTLMGERK